MLMLDAWAHRLTRQSQNRQASSCFNNGLLYHTVLVLARIFCTCIVVFTRANPFTLSSVALIGSMLIFVTGTYPLLPGIVSLCKCMVLLSDTLSAASWVFKTDCYPATHPIPNHTRSPPHHSPQTSPPSTYPPTPSLLPSWTRSKEPAVSPSSPLLSFLVSPASQTSHPLLGTARVATAETRAAHVATSSTANKYSADDTPSALGSA